MPAWVLMVLSIITLGPGRELMPIRRNRQRAAQQRMELERWWGEFLEVVSSCRNPSKVGVRKMGRYQSLIPAGTGRPKFEDAAGYWQRLCAFCATPLEARPVSGSGASISPESQWPCEGRIRGRK